VKSADYALLSQKLRNIEFNLQSISPSEYDGRLESDLRALVEAARALRAADQRIRVLEAQLEGLSTRVCASCRAKLKWRH